MTLLIAINGAGAGSTILQTKDMCAFCAATESKFTTCVSFAKILQKTSNFSLATVSKFHKAFSNATVDGASGLFIGYNQLAVLPRVRKTGVNC
jgi:hypothetical protein